MCSSGRAAGDVKWILILFATKEIRVKSETVSIFVPIAVSNMTPREKYLVLRKTEH
jgi:hypothetical protein